MDDPTPTATPESPAPAAPEAALPTPGADGGATNGTAAATPGEGAGPAPAPEMLSVMGMQIEKSKVPTELLEKVSEWNKSYTQKAQEVAGLKKRADAFEVLRNNQAFQKWYYEQTNNIPSKPAEDPFALTPEKQAELLSDPKKMQDYMQGMTLDLIQRYAVPQAKQAQLEARTLRNEQEVNRLATKYKDFDDLNNNGKVEAVMEKYASRGTDIDLEDAYWLAKRPFMESEAVLKAQERVREKANGTTLPPTGAKPSGVRVIHAKGMSFEEKLRLSAQAAAAGEKVQFDS